MRHLTFYLLAATSLAANGAVLSDVTVGGEGNANVLFRFDAPVTAQLSLGTEGVLRVLFKNASLGTKRKNGVQLDSPHLLVSALKVQPDPSDNESLRAEISVNGSVEGLDKRTKLQKTADGAWQLELLLPAGISSAAIELLKEEQTPVLSDKPKKVAASGPGSLATTAIVLLLVAVAVGGTGFAWRVLKAKGVRSGSRRYLIENLAQVPVGPQGKASVCLLRVGAEFVLIGVSGQNVSYLSGLPKLTEQYEQDTELERSSFREAVAEESRRVVPTPANRMGISV